MFRSCHRYVSRSCLPLVGISTTPCVLCPPAFRSTTHFAHVLVRGHMDLCYWAAKITQHSLARRPEHVVQRERRLDELYSELLTILAAQCSSAEQSPPTTAAILVELRLFVCVHCTEWCTFRDHRRTPSAESHARFRSARHAFHRTIRSAQRAFWTNWQEQRVRVVGVEPPCCCGHSSTDFPASRRGSARSAGAVARLSWWRRSV